MDLSVKKYENMEFMIEEIKKKLQVVNSGVILAEYFTLENYEDIHDIYEMVNRKASVSVSEIEAIISELGKLRK
ncbi:DUF1128 domain-containing protein [Bacillus sp. FJAT-45350]|uniref:DUF1128 domain-containing protein n=1 Tax=Bacillus sp. FJAT-45350 TaxID=2011014 RepID=UPI000BB95E0C|nr:DUF1128 domain-containing protein [Bacillus sp. FJAT-45350]